MGCAQRQHNVVTVVYDSCVAQSWAVPLRKGFGLHRLRFWEAVFGLIHAVQDQAHFAWTGPIDITRTGCISCLPIHQPILVLALKVLVVQSHLSFFGNRVATKPSDDQFVFGACGANDMVPELAHPQLLHEILLPHLRFKAIKWTVSQC